VKYLEPVSDLVGPVLFQWATKLHITSDYNCIHCSTMRYNVTVNITFGFKPNGSLLLLSLLSVSWRFLSTHSIISRREAGWTTQILIGRTLVPEVAQSYPPFRTMMCAGARLLSD
jgi:hypothetical protein